MPQSHHDSTNFLEHHGKICPAGSHRNVYPDGSESDVCSEQSPPGEMTFRRSHNQSNQDDGKGKEDAGIDVQWILLLRNIKSDLALDVAFPLRPSSLVLPMIGVIDHQYN